MEGWKEVYVTNDDIGGNRRLLYNEVLRTHAKVVVEFGTHLGNSTRTFAAALRKSGGRLWTVDIAPVGAWYNQSELHNVEVVTADSQNWEWAGPPIDILFLDDHNDETDILKHVAHELAVYGKKVRVGGSIFVHDVYHGKFGEPTMEVLLNWCNTYQLPMHIYPGSHGMAQIEVTHPFPADV